jgi:hypothetical protein
MARLTTAKLPAKEHHGADIKPVGHQLIGFR